MPQYQNNLQDKRIENLEKHISIINEELGSIKTDICWLKKTVQKIDNRTWIILSVIVIGFLVQILLKL